MRCIFREVILFKFIIYVYFYREMFLSKILSLLMQKLQNILILNLNTLIIP